MNKRFWELNSTCCPWKYLSLLVVEFSWHHEYSVFRMCW